MIMDNSPTPLDAARRLYEEEDVFSHFADPDRNIDEGQPEVCLQELDLLRRHTRTGAHVLVLGCAGGQESFALLRKGYRVTGLDIVPGFIAAARKHAKEKGFTGQARFEVVVRPAWPMIKDQSVDAVAMFANFISVAGTCKEVRKTLFLESRRVLKAGGVLIATGHDGSHPVFRHGGPSRPQECAAANELKKRWGLTNEAGVVVRDEHPCSGGPAKTITAIYKVIPKQLWAEIEECGLRVVEVKMDREIETDCPSVNIVAVNDLP